MWRSSGSNRMSGDVIVRSNGADQMSGGVTAQSGGADRMSCDLTMRSSRTDRMSDVTVRSRGDVPEVGHHGENTLPDDVCYIREVMILAGLIL
ncbi:hypothetical protein DPMN_021399 [Dreissena polymorpha]|uniref:Uncharacterized protein n=1 Tax=Dreissena polymorpha TaxID=45954 RepID=A0A9D4NIH6_DREPO|nr:hypothetical protein DPMN_021399 [Dreissena polymorpha]